MSDGREEREEMERRIELERREYRDTRVELDYIDGLDLRDPDLQGPWEPERSDS